MSQSPLWEPKTEYRNYADVPWYRRSGPNITLILINLFTCLPLLLLTVITLLTGDVYLNKTDAEGNLKKWSFANKVAAVLILGLNLFFWWVAYTIWSRRGFP